MKTEHPWWFWILVLVVILGLILLGKILITGGINI